MLEETSGSYSYSATIQGHHRKVVLRLGKNRDMTIPAGYWKCVDGDYYTVYIEVGEGVETTPSDSPSKVEKILKDGRLFIRHGEHVYDATGRIQK